MPWTGLTEKLNCCVMSSSGHWWCHGLTWEAVPVPANRRQFLAPFSQSMCALSVPFFLYNWLQVWACVEGKVFGSRIPSFFLSFFFLLPIQMALLSYGLVASPSSCGDCSPGWLGFFYIQPVRVALGNTLGQTVKEILVIFFFTWLQGGKAVEESWFRIHFML